VEFQITWQSADAYRKELSDFIERQQGAFEETARKLGAPQARPKLAIEIWDQRPVKTPLPDIDGGPGVSFTHTR
jgi:hypothetical protein